MSLSFHPVPSPPRWQQRISALLFIIFCGELGLFLILYPWTDSWDHNLFATFTGETYVKAAFADWWRHIWPSPYLRGAVSGLGIVNIYISLSEVFALRRHWHPDED